MSTLADFLLAKEPLLDHTLADLEKRTGGRGIDASLTAEILGKSIQATQTLGLDLDCSGKELYSALLNLIKKHDAHLAYSIGGTDPDDVAQMLPLVVRRIEKINMPRDGFFIKEQIAEQMLLKTPPRAIMDRLGYDSASAMVSHESIYELFLALRFGEDPSWLNSFNEQYHTLVSDDFVQRPIRLVPFDAHKWGDIAVHFIEHKLHNITNSKEMGAIALMPMPIKRMPGITLKAFPLILHYYNEIRLYSAFFKLLKTKKNFGEIIATTLIADTPKVKVASAKHVHWRVIQRYFGKLKDEKHPEIFAPHVQPEDLHWRQAERLLYAVDPELAFWRDMDYVAVMKKGEPVTFNLMDVSLSYSNQLSYTDRYLYHFRESLWNEIFARYLGQKTLQEQVLVKLDNDMIKPEQLKV
jgi:hypothetical protein